VRAGLGTPAASSRCRTLLLIAGSVAGLIGSIISGSRSGWLVLPVCVCLFAFHYTQGRGKHYIAAVLAAFLGLAVLAYALPESPVRARVAFGVDDLQKFQQSDNVTTSLGQRIECGARHWNCRPNTSGSVWAPMAIWRQNKCWRTKAS
jgi:O-antigen ligase